MKSIHWFVLGVGAVILILILVSYAVSLETRITTLENEAETNLEIMSLMSNNISSLVEVNQETVSRIEILEETQFVHMELLSRLLSLPTP